MNNQSQKVYSMSRSNNGQNKHHEKRRVKRILIKIPKQPTMKQKPSTTSVTSLNSNNTNSNDSTELQMKRSTPKDNSKYTAVTTTTTTQTTTLNTTITTPNNDETKEKELITGKKGDCVGSSEENKKMRTGRKSEVNSIQPHTTVLSRTTPQEKKINVEKSTKSNNMDKHNNTNDKKNEEEDSKLVENEEIAGKDEKSKTKSAAVDGKNSKNLTYHESKTTLIEEETTNDYINNFDQCIKNGYLKYGRYQIVSKIRDTLQGTVFIAIDHCCKINKHGSRSLDAIEECNEQSCPKVVIKATKRDLHKRRLSRNNITIHENIKNEKRIMAKLTDHSNAPKGKLINASVTLFYFLPLQVLCVSLSIFCV